MFYTERQLNLESAYNLTIVSALLFYQKSMVCISFQIILYRREFKLEFDKYNKSISLCSAPHRNIRKIQILNVYQDLTDVPMNPTSMAEDNT